MRWFQKLLSFHSYRSGNETLLDWVEKIKILRIKNYAFKCQILLNRLNVRAKESSIPFMLTSLTSKTSMPCMPSRRSKKDPLRSEDVKFSFFNVGGLI